MTVPLPPASQIYKAISERQSELARTLLEANPDLFAFDTPIGSWLHVAAWHGDLATVKYLVEGRELDLNLRGGLAEECAINSAAGEGQVEIVRYLLNRGATLDTDDPDRNPLWSAIMGESLEVVRLLVEGGIELTPGYDDFPDALQLALAHRKGEIASYLVTQGLKAPGSLG